MSKYAESHFAGLEHAAFNPMADESPVVPFDWTFFLVSTGVGAVIGHELCKIVAPQPTKKQKMVCAGTGAGVGAFVAIFLTVKERQDRLIAALLDSEELEDTV